MRSLHVQRARIGGREPLLGSARTSPRLPKSGDSVPRGSRCRKLRRSAAWGWTSDAPVKKAATRAQHGIARRHLTGSPWHALAVGAEDPQRHGCDPARPRPLAGAPAPGPRLTPEGRLIDSKNGKNLVISRSSGSRPPGPRERVPAPGGSGLRGFEGRGPVRRVTSNLALEPGHGHRSGNPLSQRRQTPGAVRRKCGAGIAKPAISRGCVRRPRLRSERCAARTPPAPRLPIQPGNRRGTRLADFAHRDGPLSEEMAE